MKKCTRILSAFLTIAMLAVAVPVVALESGASITDGLELVLSLENLLDTTNDAENAIATVSETLNTYGGGKLSETGYLQATNGGWVGVHRATSLELNNQSEYTITYTMNIGAARVADSRGRISSAVTFTVDDAAFESTDCYTAGEMAPQGVFHAQESTANGEYIMVCDGTSFGSAEAYNGGSSAVKSYDSLAKGSSYECTIVLKKNALVYFIDGEQYGPINLKSGRRDANKSAQYYNSGVLVLGLLMRVPSPNNTDAMSISNIKVYNGVSSLVDTTLPDDGPTVPDEITPEPDVDGGTHSGDFDVSEYVKDFNVLLSLDNLADPTNNELGSTVTYQPGTMLTGSAANAASGDYIMAAKKDDHSFGWFGTTNLELSATSKYTISFTARSHQNVFAGNRDVIGFTFAGNKIEPTEEANVSSVFLSGTTVYTGPLRVYPNGNDRMYGKIKYDTTVDPRVEHDYLLVLSGYVLMVYVDGVFIGGFDLSQPNSADANPFVAEGNQLALGVVGRGDFPDGIVVDMKNIKVYDGAVSLVEDNVKFMKDGKIIGSMYAPAGMKITDEMFPQITAEDGKLIRWCFYYKESRQMVMTPFTVPVLDTGIVFIAYEIYEADIAFAAVQTTAVDASSNTVGVRFISTLQSLQADAVGFEITAKFAGGEKVINKESKNVYSSINATANGTVKSVSAIEIGGTYLYVLAVTDVPANGQIDFYVRSYIKVNGVKTYSSETPVIVSLVNGVVNQTVAPLAG